MGPIGRNHRPLAIALIHLSRIRCGVIELSL
jgi:hypothetical protein